MTRGGWTGSLPRGHIMSIFVNEWENPIMRSFDITPRINVAVSRTKMSLMDRKLRNKQKGLTMVEYAVAGSLIVLGAVLAFTALGEAVAEAINDITATINGTATN